MYLPRFRGHTTNQRKGVGGCAGTSLTHDGSTFKLARLKGSAANVLVPDNTVHRQRSHVNLCIGGSELYESTQRTNNILGRAAYNVLAHQLISLCAAPVCNKRR